MNEYGDKTQEKKAATYVMIGKFWIIMVETKGRPFLRQALYMAYKLLTCAN